MRKPLKIPRERLFRMMPGQVIKKDKEGVITVITARPGEIHKIYPDNTYEDKE